MDSYSGPAISIEGLHLTYGFAKSKVEILRDLNMCVETGIIYGLLGPSGCGKTSLVRSIIGRSSPNKGIIEIYGQTPGSVNCEIPEFRMGYMPQELALYQDLNIKEILNYFGCLHHMNKWNLEKGIHSLTELLELPNGFRIIQQLSGGQKRRVSLAIALLHEPQLIILDEPTVGVDPILRESIWNHLVTLCSKGQVTVVITTHYIEETRQANKVGIMRNGRLIIEENPVVLLNRYDVATLEAVYHKLCVEDNLKEDELNTIDYKPKKSILSINNARYSPSEKITIPPVLVTKKPKRINFLVKRSLGRISALATKNFIQMRRNLILLIFQFVLPAIQIIAFCLTIGGDPHDVPVAIYNEDIDLGLKFLQKIDNTTVHKISVDSYEKGLDLVVNGEAAGLMHISAKFSNALINRFITKGNASHTMVKASSIRLRLDTTDQQITFFLTHAFLKALYAFSEEMVPNVKKYPQIISSLLEVGEPIYGNNDDETHNTEFMACGIILTIMYFTTVGLTSLTFIIERNEGMYERSSIYGVTSFEMMCGYFLKQMGVMVIQAAVVLFFAIEVFNVHTRGSLLLISTSALLHGLCGMSVGFFLSTVCNDLRAAIAASLMIYFPCLAMSGILWPTLGMSNFNKKFSQGLPHTLATESMRWIMLRGRDMSWTPVWLGILATVSWTFGFIILSAIIMRFRKL